MIRSLLALLAAAGAVAASAQSNPLAGTWNGTTTITDSITCECSGDCATHPVPQGSSCTQSGAWYGMVDPQGYFTYAPGPSLATCSNGSGASAGWYFPPIHFSQTPLDSDGVLSLAAQTFTVDNATQNTKQTCDAWKLTFNRSPGGVSGSQSCVQIDTGQFPTAPPATQTCTTRVSFTIAGARPSPAANTALPPFPMTVMSDVSSTRANVVAQVQPPSQVVATTSAMYVFAHVPQSVLTGQPHDDAVPDPCALAQLDSTGKLVAVSATSLRAYRIGIASSASQAITVLDSVPTPSVAGASFFIGFGESSSAMLSSGLYQGVASVPGAASCSAALLTGAAPTPPDTLTGLWWNPADPGWGVSVIQRRNNVFAAWFTDGSYQIAPDMDGPFAYTPVWYVAPNCVLTSATNPGTCTSTLYGVGGSPYFTSFIAFDPSVVRPVSVGSMTFSFKDANSATMDYTKSGKSGSTPIVREIFQAGATAPAVDYTDLWWLPSEPGWGMAITQQFGMIVIAWFAYNDGGAATWYIVPNCVAAGSSCSGTVYEKSDTGMQPQWPPIALGTIAVTFTDANNGIFTYTYKSSQGTYYYTKPITRQVF
jgi:hypothetical protein